MSKGAQAVQSTHAAINFIFENPDRAGPWWKDSNYLIQKVVPTEEELYDLIQKCRKKNIFYTVFREPDIGNLVTAIALEPSILSQRVVSKLPLLFQNETN